MPILDSTNRLVSIHGSILSHNCKIQPTKQSQQFDSMAEGVKQTLPIEFQPVVQQNSKSTSRAHLQHQSHTVRVPKIMMKLSIQMLKSDSHLGQGIKSRYQTYLRPHANRKWVWHPVFTKKRIFATFAQKSQTIAYSLKVKKLSLGMKSIKS